MHPAWSNVEKRDKDIPGQNERSSSTPALKIVALVSTPGYLQCKKINWVINDNPQRKNALPWSFPTCRPHHVIIRVLYVEERILSIPGTQSDAPILTRAPPGTKLQSNSSFKSQDSSDCTWSSALKRRALKNYIFSNSSAVKAIFRIRQTRVDVILTNEEFAMFHGTF